MSSRYFQAFTNVLSLLICLELERVKCQKMVKVTFEASL